MSLFFGKTSVTVMMSGRSFALSVFSSSSLFVRVSAFADQHFSGFFILSVVCHHQLLVHVHRVPLIVPVVLQ